MLPSCPGVEVAVGILFVSDVYFPRVNGVSTSIQTFRRDLAALGCETWLIAPSYPGAWQDDAGILRQPSRYLVFDPEDRMMHARAARRAGLALGGRIEAVHIHTPFIAHWVGKGIARELRVPVLETYHTFFEEYLHHYVPLLPRALARAFARGASLRQCNAVDAVVAPSRQLADVLVGYGVERPVHVIPTGLNLDEFAGGDGAGFRIRHGISLGRPVMLLVGRVAHEKNIGFLLRVLAAVRACSLRAPKRRGSCCWRAWHSAFRWCRRPFSAQKKFCMAPLARSSWRKTSASSPPPLRVC